MDPNAKRPALSGQARYALASAALLTLSFPPINLRWLVLVSLVPFLWALGHRDQKHPFRLGYLFGFFWQLSALHWLGILAVRWTGNWTLSWIPWVAASAICALYFAAWSWCSHKLWSKAPWMAAVLWGVFEYLKGSLPVIAFPYAILATPLYPFPWLLGMARLGDAVMVSAFVVLIGVALAQGLLKESLPRLGATCGLVVACLLLCIALPVPVVSRQVRVAAGQPGVDLAFSKPDEEFLAVSQNVPALFDRARGADLLVLPEGLVQGGDSLPPSTPFTVPDGVPVIFGGKRGNGPIYQTAFAYDGTWNYADKTRLVIFGEYVPLRDKLPLLANFNLATADLTPGTELKALDVGSLRVGPLLCFEALFPDLARKQAANGAQILAVMSVDDWYMGTGAPEVLKAGTVFRCAETGLPAVRAGGLGHSMIVDGTGRILAEIPLAATQVATAKVGVR